MHHIRSKRIILMLLPALKILLLVVKEKNTNALKILSVLQFLSSEMSSAFHFSHQEHPFQNIQLI